MKNKQIRKTETLSTIVFDNSFKNQNTKMPIGSLRIYEREDEIEYVDSSGSATYIQRKESINSIKWDIRSGSVEFSKNRLSDEVHSTLIGDKPLIFFIDLEKAFKLLNK
jgi:hypothetical protein